MSKFQKLRKQRRDLKFKELYEQKPFLTLSRRERYWWIRYEKLRIAAAKTEFEKYGKYGKFPEFHDGPLLDRPWFKIDHPINHVLNIIQKFVEGEGFDWEHLQDYKVNMVFCERHPGEGCEGCNSFNHCKIKE